MLTPEIVYYLWAILLLLACGAAWLTQLFTLPGNWLIVGCCVLFVLFVPDTEGQGIGWTTVAILTALAAVGELLEFTAGAAGAAKQGASRRAVLLALLGSLLGSVSGAIVGVPLPLIGSLLGAVGGGAVGAFLGAYVGEMWKGTGSNSRLSISKGALIGRLLGTAGKLAVGAVMFVIVAVDAFFGAPP